MSLTYLENGRLPIIIRKIYSNFGLSSQGKSVLDKLGENKYLDNAFINSNKQLNLFRFEGVGSFQGKNSVKEKLEN